MTPAILTKLQNQIGLGLKTEAQVVYFLTAVRKIIEQEGLGDTYKYLKFYCDWSLHTRLTGTGAQEVLKLFNLAHIEMKNSNDLPASLRKDVDKFLKFDLFNSELSKFLTSNGLTNFLEGTPNSWTQFLYLYVGVVEDCPLKISPKASKDSDIEEINLNLERAHDPDSGQLCYMISWRMKDRSGISGEIFVINSFDEQSE